MTGYTPAAAGGLAGARAWVQTHQGQAAAGAGALGVAAFALYKRRTEAGDATDEEAAATGTDPNLVSAGLTGTPATSGTDIETWVQDALNDQNSKVAEQLADAAKPVTSVPAAPTPAPRPGALRYKIVAGDTLRKISLKVYGRATNTSINDIKRGNPIFYGWSPDAALTTFIGNVLIIPKTSPEPKKPPAKKPVKKPPRRRAPKPKKPPKKKKPKPPKRPRRRR